VIPGVASVCTGEVFHRRTAPISHAFRQRVGYVWLDPDLPDDLCRHHRLWSANRPAVARFRRADYGNGSTEPLGSQAKDDLESVLGWRPRGEVRMLTQVRRWGWLFNPITLFVLWDLDPNTPIGAVLEVTNTPWKERHRYVLRLEARPHGLARTFVAAVPKVLHVSPFLGERFDYRIALTGAVDSDRMFNESVDLSIDVVPAGSALPILTTHLQVDCRPASKRSLGRALRGPLAPTHRVSAGIHIQAARLWLKRVPFVAHPSRRRPTP
jgi:uncharacterized protein